MSRYRVVELAGYRVAKVGGNAVTGLSVHVQDTVYGYQVVGTWQSEDYAYKKCNRAEAKLRARRDARAAADRLNAAARCPQ